MSKLSTIKKITLKEPPKILLYTPEGFGKSTFANSAPKSIFLDADAGSGQMAANRYPFYPEYPENDVRRYRPLKLEDIREAIADLTGSPHEFSTCVFDTVDVIEKFIHTFVVARDKAVPDGDKEHAPGISSYGYGKGYDVALDEWIVLCNEIERLRLERGMTIIMLSQMSIKKFEPPHGAAFERYEMAIDKKSAAFLRRWCHVVGFGHFDDHAEKLDKKNKLAKAKGFDTGRRLIEFRRKATHDAKSRYALPDTIELTMGDPWAPFAKALSDAQNMTVDQLIEAIKAECVRVDDPKVNENVQKYIEGRKPEVLHEVLSQLREKPSKNEEVAE